MLSPSGEQFEIAFGDQRARRRGRRRASHLLRRNRELIDGYGPGEMCPSGRGQVLMPWPNRLAGGAYEFAGRDLQLPVNEPGTGSAIHGLVRWAAWSVVEREPHRVVVRHDLHPQPGYPFALAIRIEYALSAEGCGSRRRRPTSVAIRARSAPAPIRIFVPARRWSTRRSCSSPPEACSRSTRRDPRRRRRWRGRSSTSAAEAVGGTRLDHCFTDLQRGDDGLTRVTSRAPRTAAPGSRSGWTRPTRT